MWFTFAAYSICYRRSPVNLVLCNEMHGKTNEVTDLVSDTYPYFEQNNLQIFRLYFDTLAVIRVSNRNVQSAA